MAVILNNKKSTYGSPYCYYTVEYTSTSNRTATDVDITFKVTSHLAYSSSSFGTGRTLKAQLYINGTWRDEQTLKASNESWSGTSNHTKTFTLTISNLNASTTTLSGVQFKVKSSASDQASGLDATSCSDITIPSGHTPPDTVRFNMTEASNSPVYGIVNDNVIAENLSVKQFNVTCNLYDDATFSKAILKNYDNVIKESTSTSFTVDFSTVGLIVNTSVDRIPFKAIVQDSKGGEGFLGYVYQYIPYTPPAVIESSIIAKRTYQVTGNVVLSLSGTYYNGADLNQGGTYQPTIKYKFWEAGDDEPDTYGNTISASSVTISNGTFSVSNYSLGNSFELNKSYKIKVQVNDTYKTTAMSEPKTIPYGEALWTEYKDRVDFKKLTIGGVEVTPMTTTTGTPTFTKTSGNGNITSTEYVKYGKCVDLFIIFNTSGGSTSAGSNIWEGSLDDTNLYPKISGANGVGYYGATHFIGNLTSNGTLTIRALGGTVASNSSDHGLHIHYISV